MMSEYQGARFYKCALQVNPWAYLDENGKARPEGITDENEYNEAIAQACIDNKIEVVGLANHNDIRASVLLWEKLKEKGIVVFPGFEISSSEKIHMVCLYPADCTEDAINGYLGQVLGENYRGGGNLYSSHSCQEIANIVLNTQNGFWYAPHMTRTNGLLRLSGAGDGYITLWKRTDLVIAGHIPSTLEQLINSENGREFGKIIANKNHEYKRDKQIVVINAKDICSREDLSDLSGSCLVKMTKPTFDAFKNAFADAESRIKLNHDVQESPHSYIKSIEWQGASYFRENHLALSRHLNVCIGGRGTGKSTLLESIRYALGMENDADKSLKELYRENFSDSKIVLKVVSKKQHQGCYTISRRHGESPQIIDEEGNLSNLEVSDLIPEIKILGQNEIIKIEGDRDKKISLIKKLLPDNSQYENDIHWIKKQLVENRGKILHAFEKWDDMKAIISPEKSLNEQLKQFEKSGIVQKLKSATFLTRENQIKDQIQRQFNEVQQWLEDYQSVFDLLFLEADDIAKMPNAGIIQNEAIPLLNRLKVHFDEIVKQAEHHLESEEERFGGIQSKWNSESARIQDELNTAIAQLPEQGGRSGTEIGKEYSKIVKQLSNIANLKPDAKKQENLIQQLLSEREKLFHSYTNAAFTRYNSMQKEINNINKLLAQKVRITLKSKENKEELKSFLKTIDGISEGRVQWIDGADVDIDIMEWVGWARSRQASNFMERYKDNGLTKAVADKLAGLGREKILLLYEIELKDTVEIELNIAHANATPHYVAIDKLSTGQRCTAILNLLLLSKDDPLIIDQPEDNLDNAFIAERIVQDIRSEKNNRQFILATHNANIPVFGDAELIAVLAYEEERKGAIKHQGSIDNKQVSKEAAEILEGGREAFNIRKVKYGF